MGKFRPVRRDEECEEGALKSLLTPVPTSEEGRKRLQQKSVRQKMSQKLKRQLGDDGNLRQHLEPVTDVKDSSGLKAWQAWRRQNDSPPRA